MQATMIPRKRGRIVKFLSVVGDDGGTEPLRGRSVSTSLVRIPFTEEGSANHFQRGMPC